MKTRLGRLAVVLFLAACGGAAPQPADSAGAVDLGAIETSSVEDVCALLSPEALAAAVGGSWGEPRNVPGGQSIECDYVEEESASKFFVAVYNEEAVTAAGGAEAMLASLAYPSGAAGTDIGTGDRALFFSFPHVRNFVVMLTNGAVIQISGETSFGIEFDQESMTNIARTVWDNL